MGKQALWRTFSHAVAQAIPESAIEQRVLAYIQASGTKPYAIACSGGVDSLALLLWARGSPIFFEKSLMVLHYNHQTRGECADADEAFVKDVTEALGCAYRSATRHTHGKASEAALREDRFAFFHTTMQAEGIEALLLGHQVNDVAETLLMRLGRGSGTRGLAAPRPVQRIGPYVHLRPFLDLSKAAIVGIMQACGVPWREDASNAEGLYVRNRIRHNVLPALEGAFQGVKDKNMLKGFALSRALLEEEDAALEAWLGQILKDQDLAQGLARACLTGLPRAIWRRALHAFLRFHGLQDRLCASGFAKLLNGFYEATLRPFSVGDKILFLKNNESHKNSVLFCIKKDLPPPSPCLDPITLQEGQVIDFPNAYSLSVESFSGTYAERLSGIRTSKGSLYQAFLAADGPLYYRFWHPGDRYRPLNAPGSKKLQDLFVDKKVPKALRRQLPVILDAAFQPVWAPGLPVADSHKILPTTQIALKLTYTKNV